MSVSCALSALPAQAADAGAPYGQQCRTTDQLKTMAAAEQPNPAMPVRVAQICVDAVTQPTTPPRSVYVAPPSGPVREQATLKDGERFESGTTFSTPPNTLLDFALDNGNLLRASNGSRCRVSASDRATAVEVFFGKLRFTVVRALSAFDVKGDHVVAAVAGTVFDVDLEPGASEKFEVSEGTVLVTRSLTIHLAAEKRDVDGIRQTDVIAANATSSVSYALPFGIFKEFPDAAAARVFFTQQLHDATLAGDKPGIENSLYNLDKVSTPAAGVPVNPAQATHAASGLNALTIAAIAVAVGAGIAVAATSGSNSSSSAASNLPGSVKITARPLARQPQAIRFGLQLLRIHL